MSEGKNESIYKRDAALISNALKLRYAPMNIDRGQGVRIYDLEGRSYLDFMAGWCVAQLGYSNEKVRSAIIAQLEKTTYGGLISIINQPAADLAEKLTNLMPGDFQKKTWFGLSGSDASETVRRLVMQATGKRRLISFIGSWHGNTDAGMGLSAHASLSGFIGGANVTKVPYPSPYRNPFGGGSENVTDRCLDFLENYLFKTICPPNDVAAVFVECVQSDSGDVVPPPDFMPKLRSLCDRYDIYLVVDDIKVGLGRTGKMFSYEHGNVVADAVILGKALGGGLPLSAVVARSEILDAGGALYTTSGNATCCAAGLATLECIQNEGLVELAATNGQYLHEQLQNTFGKYDVVGDVRGLGMVRGIEIVKDRTSKEPDRAFAAKVSYRAYELGLIVYYCGNWANVLEITPPLIVRQQEIDEGIAILDRAFQDVLDGKVTDADIARFSGWP